MSIIKDGTGTSSLAKVSTKGRLSTFSITETEELFQIGEGNAYNIETPTFTLTGSVKSAVLYVKNNEEKDLIITGFFTLLGTSTGGTGDLTIFHEFNTVAGSIVSTANTITPVNKNAGSAKSLDVDAYYGFNGATVDTGLKSITSLSTATGRNPLLVSVTLPKSKSITVSVTPQSGNTSMQILAALDCHLKSTL